MVDVKSIAYTDPVTQKTIAVNLGDTVSFEYMQPVTDRVNRSGSVTRIRILSPQTKVSPKYRQDDPKFKRGSILVNLDNNKSFYLDRSKVQVVSHN